MLSEGAGHVGDMELRNLMEAQRQDGTLASRLRVSIGFSLLEFYLVAEKE